MIGGLGSGLDIGILVRDSYWGLGLGIEDWDLELGLRIGIRIGDWD